MFVHYTFNNIDYTHCTPCAMFITDCGELDTLDIYIEYTEHVSVYYSDIYANGVKCRMSKFYISAIEIPQRLLPLSIFDFYQIFEDIKTQRYTLYSHYSNIISAKILELLAEDGKIQGIKN